MSQFPTNAPQDISVGDPIRAEWLNRVKKQSGKISVNAPLTITQTSVGNCIGFEKGYSYLRWGVVTRPPRSDYGYVVVHPVNGFKDDTGEVNRDIKVFYTNPVEFHTGSSVSDIYDIPSDSIISYLNFSYEDIKHYGMFVGTPDDTTALYGYPTSDFYNATTVRLAKCDKNGVLLDLPNVSVRAGFGNRVFEGKITDNDLCSYVPRKEVSVIDETIGDLIGIRNGTHDTPFEIYGTYEGTENVQNDVWKRIDQTATDGFIIPVLSRVGYWDTGDEILYGYYRNLMVDSSGMINSVGSELRYIVDEPVECTPTDIDGGTY